MRNRRRSHSSWNEPESPSHFRDLAPPTKTGKPELESRSSRPILFPPVSLPEAFRLGLDETLDTL
jgi:hypothetical protein